MFSPGMILHKSVNCIFNELGPTPQLCIDCLCSHELIEKYRQDIQEAISNLMTSEPQQLLQDSHSLTIDEFLTRFVSSAARTGRICIAEPLYLLSLYLLSQDL